MSVTIRKSGPFLTGRNVRFDGHLDEMREEVAQYGLKALNRNMNVFRRPTGNYRSKTRIARRTNVHIIGNSTAYTNWLEHGGGRFAGYQLWSKAYKETNRQTRRIVGNIVTVQVRRLQ